MARERAPAEGFGRLALSLSLNLPFLSLSLYAQAAGCIGYDVGNIVGFLALMHVQRLPPRARVHGSGLTIGDRSVCERERGELLAVIESGLRMTWGVEEEEVAAVAEVAHRHNNDNNNSEIREYGDRRVITLMSR